MCLEFAFKRGGIGILKNFMVSQKVHYRKKPKKDFMLVFKQENMIKENFKNKIHFMFKTLLNFLNNFYFEYNLFIMNIFAFYLALQYIKIIGDFANKPDAFDDPSILKMLEQEVSDDPVKNQGFLTQIYIQQDKISDSLQFEFEKIQKQELIQKYSQKGTSNSNLKSNGIQATQGTNIKKADLTKQKNTQNNNQVKQNTQQSQKTSKDIGINNNTQNNQTNTQNDQSTTKSKQDNKKQQNQSIQQPQQNNSPSQSNPETQQKSTTQNSEQNNTQNDTQSKTQTQPKQEQVQQSNQQPNETSKQSIDTQQQTIKTAHLHKKNILNNKQHFTETKQPIQVQSQIEKPVPKLKNQPQIQQKKLSSNTKGIQTNESNFKQDKQVQTEESPSQTQVQQNQQKNQEVQISALKEETKSALKKATDVVVKVIALIFIILSLIAYTLMVVFGHKLILQEIQSGVANGYTEFIEKQQEVKTLQKEMKNLLQKLYWRSIRGQKEGDAIFYNEQGVELETEYAGQRYSFNLTVPLNSTFTLVKIDEEKTKKKKHLIITPKYEKDSLGFKEVSLFNVKSGPQFLYYEIQVDYLHDKTDFVIGFTSKKLLKEIKNDYVPGFNDNSYGFRVKTGEILNNGNIVYTFNMLEEIMDVYDMDDSKNFDFNGSFFGIGISINTKEFFFSYNGRILNSLSFQTTGEIRFQIFNKKRKDELEADFYLHKQDKINQVARALKLEKNQREEIKRNPKFKSKLNSYVPIIYVNGISGYPLQLKERQIRTGLLKKDIMKEQLNIYNKFNQYSQTQSQIS